MSVVGEAVYDLTLDDSGLQGGLHKAEASIRQAGDAADDAFGKKATGATNRWGEALGGLQTKTVAIGAALGGLAANAITGAMQGLVGAITGAIGAASDLNEEIDKSKVVFGDAAGRVQAFADTASSIGLTKAEALGAAGALGNMFRTTGLATGASADMSVRMVQLAADMGSFNNEDPSAMLDRLRSGLAGESEPLRQFGVLMTDAAVKTFAYTNGIAAAGAELTEGQKVQARYGLILEQTALQHGNYAATADGAANSGRTFNAMLGDFAAKAGAVVLPAFTALLHAGIGLLGMVDGLAAGIGFLMPGIIGVGAVIGAALIPAFIAWAAAATAAAVATIVAMAPILVPIAAIGLAVGALAVAWNNNFLGIRDVVGTVAGFIASTLGALVEGIQSAMGLAGDAINDMALNFGDMGDRVHAIADAAGLDFQTVKDRVKEYMSEMGLSFEEAAAKADAEFGTMTATHEEMVAASGAAWEKYQTQTTTAMDDAVTEVETGVTDMATEIGEAPGKMADELLANQFKLTDATTELVNFMENALTPAQEKFQLQGFLASSELAAGLASGNPLVRTKAEEMRDDAIARIAEIDDTAHGYGYNVGVHLAGGMDASRPLVAAASSRLGSAAGGAIHFSQAPSFGPLKDIDTFGVHLDERFAASIARGAGMVARSGALVAQGLRAALMGVPLGLSSLGVPALALASGVPSSSSVSNVSLGGLGPININLPAGWQGTRSDVQRLSRELADQVRLAAPRAFIRTAR